MTNWFHRSQHRPYPCQFTPNEHEEYMSNLSICTEKHEKTGDMCTLNGDHIWHKSSRGLMWQKWRNDGKAKTVKYTPMQSKSIAPAMRMRTFPVPNDQYVLVVDRVPRDLGQEFLTSVKGLGEFFKKDSDGACIGIMVITEELELEP